MSRQLSQSEIKRCRELGRDYAKQDQDLISLEIPDFHQIVNRCLISKTSPAKEHEIDTKTYPDYCTLLDEAVGILEDHQLIESRGGIHSSNIENLLPVRIFREGYHEQAMKILCEKYPIFLKVPFSEKDDARNLGAKWSVEFNTWYVCPNFEDISIFSRWLELS